MIDVPPLTTDDRGNILPRTPSGNAELQLLLRTLRLQFAGLLPPTVTSRAGSTSRRGRSRWMRFALCVGPNMSRACRVDRARGGCELSGERLLILEGVNVDIGSRRTRVLRSFTDNLDGM